MSVFFDCEVCRMKDFGCEMSKNRKDDEDDILAV